MHFNSEEDKIPYDSQRDLRHSEQSFSVEDTAVMVKSIHWLFVKHHTIQNIISQSNSEVSKDNFGAGSCLVQILVFFLNAKKTWGHISQDIR